MSSVELIYSSSFFKSLATGGNVSKALVRLWLSNSLNLNCQVCLSFCLSI